MRAAHMVYRVCVCGDRIRTLYLCAILRKTSKTVAAMWQRADGGTVAVSDVLICAIARERLYAKPRHIYDLYSVKCTRCQNPY